MAVCAAVVLSSTVASPAGAALIEYNFVTGANPTGTNPGPVNSFPSDAFVSGMFTYDNSAPASSTNPDTTINYNGSLVALTGTVAGNNFSDPRGFTTVGNDAPVAGFPGPVDYLQVSLDPNSSGGVHNIVGFSVPGFTLVNARLFWIEGQLGIGDFLNSSDLPQALPSFQGRMALDFTPTGNPTGPRSFVFFDGLQVTPVAVVPLPAPLVLFLSGLGAFAFAQRRHQSRISSS
jgi:hypothetical protein